MIASSLFGGLGNQLYQVAAVYSHARKHGLEFVINFYKDYKPAQGKSPVTYQDTLYRKIKVVNQRFPYAYQAHGFDPVEVTQGFNYAELPQFHATQNVMYFGLFLSWKYFKEYKKEVVELLSFRAATISRAKAMIDALKEKYGVSRVVGVHIRRGDYINNPYSLTVVKGDYYERAKRCFEAEDTVFIYSTCSPADVRQEFTFDEKNILMSEGSELSDLCVLSQCDSLIMANSTFSAWASYLGKAKEKVICPLQWFDETGPKEYDIIDPDWTQM